MHRAHVLLLAVATIFVASRETRAQCSGGNRTRINTFTVTPTALVLPAATTALFNAGWSQSSYSIVIKPQGPNRWYLCVSTLALSMGTVNGYTKPLSDLQWSLDGTAWTSFTFLTPQSITNGTGPTTLTVFIRARLDYAGDTPQANGTPGTYSANIIFQASM